MTIRVRCAALAAAAIACWSVATSATIVGGGGGATKDCLAVFDADVNFPPSKPRQVRCVDGDSSCDDDATVNGSCDFRVAVCANSTFDSSCTLDGLDSIVVDHAIDNGDPHFDPAFQALQNRINSDIDPPTANPDVCTATTIVRVPIKGPLGLGRNHCGPGHKKIALTAQSQLIGGKVVLDRDKLKLVCEPAASGGCDPQILFPSGTFNRIQQQVFNQNCALSGCHDSQSLAGNMLLETGASYDNLVDHVPDNSSAATAGWKRVDSSGNLETSFLYRKIFGDLPDVTYGARMPFGRPKLNKTLRELIRLWIEAGAPKTGWVSGTD
jgi:hypothetical protein